MNTTVTIPTEGMPAVITLDTDHLACAGCGIGVPRPHFGSDLEEFGTTWRVLVKADYGHTPVPAVRMTRCVDCRALHEQATALLDEHPAVQHSIGSRSIALYRVESALLALDALGQTSPAIRTVRDLRLLTDHVAGGVQWSREYANKSWSKPEDVPQHCTSARWAHVTEEQRQGLRDGFASLLRARAEATERPRAYAPPKDGPPGCLLCGVGSVTVLPSQEYEAWRPLAVSPFAIGGPRATERIEGYLCPTCDHAVSEAGAIGPSAMEQSIRRHLGVVQRSYEPVELVGLVGWGALPEGTTPNRQPWEHIANLPAIRDELG